MVESVHAKRNSALRDSSPENFDSMHFTFWLKTLLYTLTPGGFGYYRRLRRLRDSGYVHHRDKHPVRQKHHGQGGWKQQSGGPLRYRDYDDYDEYLTHQVQKFDEMLKIKGGFTNREILLYRLRFYRRFRHLPRFLPPSAAILCAGARQGTEVEVLRDLGFNNASGIDLNPGPDNPLVQPGDFMHLQNDTSTLDLIYCNSVDHAYDLEAFFAEHARALKPRGFALYDLPHQEGGAFEAVRWGCDETLVLLMLKHFTQIVKVESEPGYKWILLQGKRIPQPS